MSVLIKGMKMPEDCFSCQLKEEGFCNITNVYAGGINERNSDCPLVEIPETHGRLIDAYELWNKMLNYTDNMGAKFPYGDDDSMIHRDSACFMIESADTIVEAEGV